MLHVSILASNITRKSHKRHTLAKLLIYMLASGFVQEGGGGGGGGKGETIIVSRKDCVFYPP